jgi:hypothetical protein
MVTPTASAAITTINRCGATIEQATKPESKIQRFGCLSDAATAEKIQLQTTAKPVKISG